MTIYCVVCGSIFEAKSIRRKYCCPACKNHSRFHRTHEQIRAENENLKNEIKHLYDLGLKDKQIAEKIDRSKTWVQKKRIELGLPRQKSKRQYEIERLDEWRKVFENEKRICKRCKAEFSPIRVNQLFCCPECEKKNNHQVNDIKRKRLEKQQRVDDISLDAVYKKYNGVCYLCGGKCNYQAVKVIKGIPHALGDYPSREHIIPLSKGGLHSWDNVRLAHIRCNSKKGVSYG